jgi:hypothetical protein
MGEVKAEVEVEDKYKTLILNLNLNLHLKTAIQTLGIVSFLPAPP